MAKVRFGSVVIDARGSACGTNFTQSKAGPFFRRVPSHTVLSSAAAILERSRFASLVPRWYDTLTALQRTNWNALSPTFPRTDVFGNSYQLTGLQLYISSNRIRSVLGLAPIDDAPADLTVTALASLSISTATAPATLTLAYTPTPAGADNRFYVYASPSLSPGVTVTDRYYWLGASALDAASPFTAGALYSARLGSLIATRRVFVRAALIRPANGAISPFKLANAVVS